MTRKEVNCDTERAILLEILIINYEFLITTCALAISNLKLHFLRKLNIREKKFECSLVNAFPRKYVPLAKWIPIIMKRFEHLGSRCCFDLAF